MNLYTQVILFIIIFRCEFRSLFFSRLLLILATRKLAYLRMSASYLYTPPSTQMHRALNGRSSFTRLEIFICSRAEEFLAKFGLSVYIELILKAFDTCIFYSLLQ
jgi:hypothetical protein